jgi:hypothetical protein
MEINYEKIYTKFRDIEESLTRLKQFGPMAREDF